MEAKMTTMQTPTALRSRRIISAAAAILGAALISAPALAWGDGGHNGGGHSGGGGHGFAGHASVGHGFAGHASVGGFAGHAGFAGGGWGHGYGGWGWGGYRHFGPAFYGFGYYYDPYLAWPFLGLAAWELADYNYMTEAQIRAQENAMIEATSAPLSVPIAWDDGNSSGAVTPLREGHTQDGRMCREFQQQVSIDGKRQQAFGTACQQPDGSWQIVSQGATP
jgi:hypothetical protein